MARIKATLVVEYVFEVEAYGTPTEDEAWNQLEEAYADGDTGILDGHSFSDVEVIES